MMKRDLEMEKRVTRKEDGRYLIYYTFSDKEKPTGKGEEQDV